MTTREQITTFFDAKVPKSWFVGAPKIELDDDEVLYVGTLPDSRSADDFRGETRAERVAIASEAETRFRRKVSWGVVAQGETVLFTTHGARSRRACDFPSEPCWTPWSTPAWPAAGATHSAGA